MSTLILIRHGQSQWNVQNLFTGWVNVDLTDQGIAEATSAGQRLKAKGLHVDKAFTSGLQRAQKTGRLVLENMGQPDLPQEEAWQLNERFYGALQGKNKAETAKIYGDEQVHIWRRSFDTRPPAGESLKDTLARVLPFFNEVIIPATKEFETVLVSAHGNSLRAIVKELDQLSDEEIPGLELGTGVPLVYTLDNGVITDKEILA